LLLVSHCFNSFKVIFLFCDDFLFLPCLKSFVSHMHFLHVTILEFGQFFVQHVLMLFLGFEIFNSLLRPVHSFLKLNLFLTEFLCSISPSTAHKVKLGCPLTFEICPHFVHGVICLAESFVFALFLFLELLVLSSAELILLAFKSLNANKEIATSVTHFFDFVLKNRLLILFRRQ